MAQFGAGTDLAAQCPVVPPPDGWRSWTDADGPLPGELTIRAEAMIGDQALPLGSTSSYPLPGVVTLIRLEPHTWRRNVDGQLEQGCFRSASVYLPEAERVEAPESPTSKLINRLTIASLAVGIVATFVSLRKGGA